MVSLHSRVENFAKFHPAMTKAVKSVTTQGKRKTTVATCTCTQSSQFSLRINKVPFKVLGDNVLRAKLKEIICIVEESNLSSLAFEITCKDRGEVAMAYAVRQAFAKAILAFYGTYYDEWKKQEIQKRLMEFDKFSLVADGRRKEPKKWGGPGARAKYQKSYR
jgi:small subunit ribosomal protein S16e